MRSTRRTPNARTAKDVVRAFGELDLRGDLPDGTGGVNNTLDWDVARMVADDARERGDLTWADLAREAATAVLAEPRPDLLRADLVHACAVLLGWLYCLDRRQALTEPVRVPRRRRMLQRRARR
ncbi:hypothetical protein [Nonomuraea sp. NPDC049646]|uniref:hypothetical protein n=1 Tax=unclassified Nonomuraea TaxID=2593643 RepID=UPI003788B740